MSAGSCPAGCPAGAASAGGDRTSRCRATSDLRALPSGPMAGDNSLGTILGVWAHPDDETYLCGGLMARAGRAGDRVVGITATPGELRAAAHGPGAHRAP